MSVIADSRLRWGRVSSGRPSRSPSRCAAIGLVGAGLLIGGGSASAATRYAAPASAGPEPCVAAAPCALKAAVEHASYGDEVVVASGDYPLSGGTGCNTDGALKVPGGVSVHGLSGQPRPRLHAAAPVQTGSPDADHLSSCNVVFAGVDSLAHLEIRQEGQQTGYFQSAVAAPANVDLNDVVAASTGAEAVRLNAGSALRNSVVVAFSTYAVFVAFGSVKLDNDTVEGGVFVRAQFQDSSAVVRNVIALGGFHVQSLSPTYRATLDVDYSDGAATNETPSSSPNPVTLTNGAHNQTAPPQFVDRMNGDYHQTPGSPTIDAGTSDAVSGAFDFDGGARIFGAATDIGADEFGAAAATVRTGGASVVGKSNATVTGSVNPNGVDTGAYFEYGRTPAYGKRTPTAAVGSDFDDHSVNAAVTGLRPSMTYHYRIVGTNSGSIGADRTFVTRADNFKGASLKKETAKVANGKAQVSLACPAGSARGCTGTLDLKTAHRVLLPGAAHTRKVNLGHATFSLGAGHTGIVRVKLTKAAKKLLLNASAVKAIATIVCHDGLGTQRRTTGKLTLTLKH